MYLLETIDMNKEKELWVMIRGFEGRYMISNKGRVKSLGRTMIARDGFTRNYPDKILKLSPHKTLGYCRARLYHENSNTYENWSAHRLVALHFIDNPENHPVVNHIDTNRSNYHVDNLEWTTIAKNLTHKGCHLKAGEKRKKKVFQYTNDGEFVQAWNSVQDAHGAGFNKNLVRKVCLRIRKRYKGFLWSYK